MHVGRRKEGHVLFNDGFNRFYFHCMLARMWEEWSRCAEITWSVVGIRSILFVGPLTFFKNIILLVMMVARCSSVVECLLMV